MAVGVGASSRATVEDIVTAVAAAERVAKCSADAIATLETVRCAELLALVASLKGVEALALPLELLISRSSDCRTRSEPSIALFGVASVCEAAALAATGPGSRLIVDRITCGHVTVAAAISSGPMDTQS